MSESYPELKANQNFQDLQRQLEETETRISQARRFYNANVRELNTAVESFPSVLIAGPCGFKQQTYYGLEDAEAYEPVRISGMLSDKRDTGDSQTIKIPEKQKEDRQ